MILLSAGHTSGCSTAVLFLTDGDDKSGLTPAQILQEVRRGLPGQIRADAREQCQDVLTAPLYSAKKYRTPSMKVSSGAHEERPRGRPAQGEPLHQLVGSLLKLGSARAETA